uniref:Serine/arginine repetitive matrix protein 1 n=1 Tax=Echinostoma caproni TaxID=27848 RepID=A0A183AHT8_9TREM
LERDVRELLQQLKSSTGRNSPIKPLMFMKPIEVSEPVESVDKAVIEDEKPPKPDWSAVMIEEHRRDMELLRNMFEKELRALQVQHAATQEELAQLKIKRAASNLGELVDDVPKSPSDKKTESAALPVTIREMSPVKEGSSTNHPSPNRSERLTPKPVSSNISMGIVEIGHSTGQTQDAVDHSVQTHQEGAHRHVSLLDCHGSHHWPENSVVGLPVSHRRTRNHSLEPPVRRHSFEDGEDEDDNAESDITYPADPRPRGIHSHTHYTRAQRGWRPKFTDGDIMNGQFHGEYAPGERKRRRYRRKRVRSAAIQVGFGRRQSPQKANIALASLSGDEPVFLKVRRPQSRSGSSTSLQNSRSPGGRRTRAASLDGRSREIVIVRTEDEDGSDEQRRRPFDTGSERSSMRSVHLMPTPTVIRPRSAMPRERIINVGSSVRSSVPESNISPSRRAVPVYDEPTLSGSKASMRSEIRSISEHVSKHSRASPAPVNTATRSELRTDGSKRRSSQSPLRASTNRVAETEDTADESDNQMVSRGMERALTASGTPSPAQSVNLSTNVLRYSRLLDQLRADPDTLRGLRHEVEQLLIEQLSERGIQSGQTRLTTTELNDRLIVLRRERENLARKHVNFFEIREALAQHVDRLANAMLHGKHMQRTSSTDLRPVSSRTQRASVIARSGLPPPAMHSPSGMRRGGTLPAPTSRRVDITSGLGSSMPILNQHETNSKVGKLYVSSATNLNAPRSYLQRSSPHLQFEETVPEELPSARSALSTGSPRQRSALGTPPGHGHGQITSNVETPPPRKTRGSPQRSRSSASPYKTPEKSSVLKSPSIQLSHDQRVLTFNRPEASNTAVAPTSSEEWDSEPDESPINATRAPLPLKLLVAACPDQTLYDEDICSVSSINGGVAEDTSLSLFPASLNKRGSKSSAPRVSRSLDPNVAAARAQAAALGPRPGTRFGSSVRNSDTVVGTAPVSICSPDMTPTLATSLWGTNSKGDLICVLTEFDRLSQILLLIFRSVFV